MINTVINSRGFTIILYGALHDKEHRVNYNFPDIPWEQATFIHTKAKDFKHFSFLMNLCDWLLYIHI